MKDDANSAIEIQAIDWVIRQRDPEFSDWESFTAWLEQDTRHFAIYDAVASMDIDIGSLPVPARPHEAAQPQQPRRFAWTRRVWLGGAIAASLVAMIGVSLTDFGGRSTRISTIAGERRTVNLADGSRIEVNGATVLEIDMDRPRFAKLESGEAMFYVVHHDDDPFTVEAGDAKLVDLGTAFNVVRNNDGTSVAVSEGIIAFNPDRENVRVAAGKGLEARNGTARPRVYDIDVQNVGGWQKGQLVYSGASIAEVASDLNRTAGMKITVSRNVGALPFRGALLVNKDHSRTIEDLTALAGIRAEQTGDGWLLTR